MELLHIDLGHLTFSRRSSGAIRVQDLWVSNWKRPVLTLLIVGEDQKNLDIELSQLVAGKVRKRRFEIVHEEIIYKISLG